MRSQRSIKSKTVGGADVQQRSSVDETVLDVRTELLEVIAQMQPGMLGSIGQTRIERLEVRRIFKSFGQFFANEPDPRLHFRLLPILQNRKKRVDLIAGTKMSQLNDSGDGRSTDNCERRAGEDRIHGFERHAKHFVGTCLIA